jgi:hypothetical protein
VSVIGLAQITQWTSARNHGALADVKLTIADTNSFSESRNGGVRRLFITFDHPIAPASFTPSSVLLAGVNLTGATLNLTSIVITTSLQSGNTVGVIDLSAALPDKARYLVRLQGVTDPGGNALLGDVDRIFTNLKGDASGDLRTNVTDLSYIHSGYANPISVSVVKQIRSDVNCDARVNATDLSVSWAQRNTDARNIPNPTVSGAELLATLPNSPTQQLVADLLSASQMLDVPESLDPAVEAALAPAPAPATSTSTTISTTDYLRAVDAALGGGL